MSITAKEPAGKLGLSPAAVSLALNHKKGVSTETTIKVLDAAKKYGYEFKYDQEHWTDSVFHGTIQFLIYKKSGAIVTDTTFFLELSQSIAGICKEKNLRLDIHYLYDNDLAEYHEKYADKKCIGILLLGTELSEEDLKSVATFDTPVVILDTYSDRISANYIKINNKQGAYLATNYLLERCKGSIGYLKSSYPIHNFSERSDGFYQALKEHGISRASAIMHELSPSFEGAYADMNLLLQEHEPLARCYFADNDLIACGALKAFKEHGFQIPDDISIIGFDNVSLCNYVDPALSTVDVDVKSIGRLAVHRLLDHMKEDPAFSVKLEIATRIVLRHSIK